MSIKANELLEYFDIPRNGTRLRHLNSKPKTNNPAKGSPEAKRRARKKRVKKEEST
jgi:hypothetical protein